MGFSCGIVGLPNVGKSTLFNALTSAKAAAANFPFCTIGPNTGAVKVPDPRLFEIAKRIPPETITPASMTFTDIAGLVKGASKGEGLGNQFLGHIREAQAVAHVVRCFDAPEIVHVAGGVDPIRDVETVDTELMLADLQTIEKRYAALEKAARAGVKEAATQYAVVSRIKRALEDGRPPRSLGLTGDELVHVRDWNLLTIKPVLYLANVAEADLAAPEKNPHVAALLARAKAEGAPVVTICGKLEAELAELEGADRERFLADMGLEEPGLNRVIRAGYALLGLQTFFTAGPKEVRAWTIRKGTKAPQAAGVIHTDFERGFIRAEIYHYEDLLKHGSEQAIRDAGLLRQEGKDYVMRDGDVAHFKFNV